MDHMTDICNKHDKYQLSTASRILWKIEKESEFIAKQEKQEKINRVKKKIIFDEKKAIYKYVRGDHRFNLTDQSAQEKYDIMISYCEDDKDICYKIYNRLMASDFHRISFDNDNLHSLDPKLMAETVERSAIIVLCFSNKYRDSHACRLEAEYAKKRKRPIIGVKLDHHYDPTGWLTHVIDKDEFIDFTKGDFNVMYGKLVNKINDINETLNYN